MSDKVKKTAEDKLNNISKGGEQKKSNETILQEAMVMGEFASRERNDFYDALHGELLVDLFEQWRNTSVEDHKLRESIYYATLGLSNITDRILQKEVLGRNIRNTGMFKEDENTNE